MQLPFKSYNYNHVLSHYNNMFIFQTTLNHDLSYPPQAEANIDQPTTVPNSALILNRTRPMSATSSHSKKKRFTAISSHSKQKHFTCQFQTELYIQTPIYINHVYREIQTICKKKKKRRNLEP